MKIELLYFEGCPSWKEAEKNLKSVLEELKIKDPVQYIKVESDEDLIQHRFIGSPTIRGNGLDIEPKTWETREYFLGCRVYNVEGILRGWPSLEMIRKALLEVKAKDYPETE